MDCQAGHGCRAPKQNGPVSPALFFNFQLATFHLQLGSLILVGRAYQSLIFSSKTFSPFCHSPFFAIRSP
jgi:hypothetical protein